ncbi:MAG: SCO family protein [Aquificae bacterium]|nr:SCO family protein [Aquificota bacterium]
MRKLSIIFSILLTIFSFSFSYQFYGFPYFLKIEDFELTNQDGKKVRLSDFKDKYLMIFFGYTYCPDVCPTTMLRIKETLDELGDYKDKVKVLFISVDPERDTPESIKKFISFYDKSGKYIEGLTGTKEEIDKVAKQFKAYYKKVPIENKEVGYLVDHTAYIYLVDPKGVLRLIYRPSNDDPKKIAEDIKRVIDMFSRH